MVDDEITLVNKDGNPLKAIGCRRFDFTALGR